MTDERVASAPRRLRQVPLAALKWFLEDAGPRYVARGKTNGGENAFEAFAREHTVTLDESGSRYGFRFMLHCHSKDMDYAQAREALLADENEAGAWARRVDERQLRRAYDNSAPKQEQAKDEKSKEAPAQCSLVDVHAVFHKWLGDDFDIDALDIVLAAAAAEQLTGDPLWLLIIGGPGAAKTEMAQALTGADAHVISTIASEGALLSASPKRSRRKDATGGLLRLIGERGILVIKDFTSILSADRNTRASVLAAVREVYDGHWVRNVGSDGGQTLSWKGRLAIIAACTTAWDAAHAVVATMGDRFALVRLNSDIGQPRARSGLRAIGNTGDEAQMREELAMAVGGLLLHAATENVRPSQEESERLVAMADIVTLSRTACERDYQGNVINTHAPEMPTRFAKQLAQVLRGCVALGMSRDRGMQLATRCACDSIPPLRLAILLDVAANPGCTPGEVRANIDKPWMTVRREMEALHMIGLLKCEEEEVEDDSDEKKTKTKWLYALAPAFDEATLMAMIPKPDPFTQFAAECRRRGRSVG